MTPEQQRKILEAAANAMGYPIDEGRYDNGWWIYIDSSGEPPNDSAWSELWNPLIDSADTASMCAKLDIGVTYHSALGFLVCRKSIDVAAVAHYKDHDNSRLKAWMYAATMVAAKIGGYTE